MMPGIVAGGVRSSSGTVYATWNPADKATEITLSNGNRTAEVDGLGIRTARATIAMSGKQYFEASFAPNGDGVGIGLARSAADLFVYLGSDSAGYGHYLPSNDVYRGGSVAYNGATNSTSPVTVGIAFDAATLEMWVIVEGGSGFEGGGDPAAGTSPTLTLAAGTYYPACTPYTGASAVTINAGQAAFSLWTPSGGFTGVS
ncbi:MAG TPA: hypothetical protein VM619_10735 [Luteimonas sp.]|nr:hypothetical protein [Luteimonas sp.]